MAEDAIGSNEDRQDPDSRLDAFKLDIINDATIVEEQRDQANEDMRFVNVTGGMWEGFLEDDFDDDRVKLEFDTVSDHLSRFLGEWNLNRIGVDYKPDDGNTSDEDAELISSIYRGDFRQFSGREATDNAVDEAATCGVGAMQLSTKHEDEEDEFNSKQRIVWWPIFNAFNTVYWDRSAQRADKLDARWCTKLKEFTIEEFNDIYPDLDAVSAYVPQTRDTGNVDRRVPDRIYIATRYHIEKKKELKFIYNNLETGIPESYSQDDHALIENELKQAKTLVKTEERVVKARKVIKSVFTGETFIEEPRRVVGKWIPIIPFYGYRGYVDGAEWYRGLVRKLKDPARLNNMIVSKVAETVGSSDVDKLILAPEQVRGLEHLMAKPTNQAYTLVRPLEDKDGNIIQQGPIGVHKAPQIDSTTIALSEMTNSFINGQTGGAPQTETIDPDASGKAIKAMRQRENLSTQRITDNFANAIRGSGVVYQSMAAEVYTTQRILRTVGKDGKESETLLLKTIFDQETGRQVESNTLEGKKFRAYADTGPQYETEREQVVEDAKGIIETLVSAGVGQDYIPAFLGVLIENMPTDGFQTVKDLNRKIMLMQGLTKPENEEEEAMLAQLQQQAQQPDPQTQFLESAARKEDAEAGNLQSKSQSNIADARKKAAEIVEIFASIASEQRELDQEDTKLILEGQSLAAEENARIRQETIELPVGQ